MDIKSYFDSKKVLDTAVIMAGGQGTRLASITGPLPKAMVNIRGTSATNNGKAKDTILEHQIKLLAENGITNFVLVVGNKKEYIQNAFTPAAMKEAVPDKDIDVKFFVEQSPLGTGGAFCSKELQQLIGHRDFLFTYSDVLFDVNVQDMFRFHKEQNADATVLISPCQDPDDRPLCTFAKGDSEIVGLIPKQGKNDGPRGSLFTNTPKNGLIILNDSFFDVVPEEPTYLDMEENILMKLIYDSKYNVRGWKTPCYIKDIGTVDRFHEGVADLKAGLPALRNPAKNPQSCVVVKESDLLRYDGGETVSLDEQVAYAIRTFNNNGIITVLHKDDERLQSYPKEDALIDTLLTRSGNGSFLNAKVEDTQEFNDLAKEWNVNPDKSFLVDMLESECLVSPLDGSGQTISTPSVISATTEILHKISPAQVDGMQTGTAQDTGAGQAQ